MTQEELQAATGPISSFSFTSETATRGPYKALKLSVAWQNGRARTFSIFNENAHDQLTEAALAWFVNGAA